jgi:glycosyltransferase involved in cell wall biosynthesis
MHDHIHGTESAAINGGNPVRALPDSAARPGRTMNAPRQPAITASALAPLTIVNLSELAPQWHWIGPAFRDTGQNWRHVSSRSFDLPAWLPRRSTLSRLLAGRRAANLLGHGPSVLVTHGPRPAVYGALLAGRHAQLRHLAYSFNFTTLPAGMARRLMARALRTVERFVVFSTLEREIYAGYFDLPPDRFDMLHWGVQAPQPDPGTPPLEHGDYICALGSQGRDYGTLLQAMKRLPGVRLVIVASPANLANLEIPANVTVRTDIPLDQAMNILAHSRFMVLPLAGSKVPCGHVTIVSAMHLGKAVIATASSGLEDYLAPQITGLSCPAHDATAWTAAIEALYDDPLQSRQFGLAGRNFAREHCTEARVVEYFLQFLQSPGRRRA